MSDCVVSNGSITSEAESTCGLGDAAVLEVKALSLSGRDGPARVAASALNRSGSVGSFVYGTLGDLLVSGSVCDNFLGGVLGSLHNNLTSGDASTSGLFGVEVSILKVVSFTSLDLVLGGDLHASVLLSKIRLIRTLTNDADTSSLVESSDGAVSSDSRLVNAGSVNSRLLVASLALEIAGAGNAIGGAGSKRRSLGRNSLLSHHERSEVVSDEALSVLSNMSARHSITVRSDNALGSVRAKLISRVALSAEDSAVSEKEIEHAMVHLCAVLGDINALSRKSNNSGRLVKLASSAHEALVNTSSIDNTAFDSNSGDTTGGTISLNSRDVSVNLAP